MDETQSLQTVVLEVETGEGVVFVVEMVVLDSHSGHSALELTGSTGATGVVVCAELQSPHPEPEPEPEPEPPKPPKP